MSAPDDDPPPEPVEETAPRVRWTLWEKLGCGLAIVLVLSGLLAMATLAFVYIALSQWGSNK